MDWVERSSRIRGRDRAWYWLASLLLLLVLAGLVIWLFDRYAPNRPETHQDPLQEFKYGSVGTDMDNGLPLEVMKILPQVFPEYLPEDWRFTPDYLIPQMETEGELSAIDETLYRVVIPLFQGQLLARKAKLAVYFGDTSSHPRWGPGRVDTFDTFKFDQFAALYQGEAISPDELYGTVDLPPIWAQDRRGGLWLHWDGNNDSVRERNFSAALAAGATPGNLDREKERLFALEEWLA